MFDKPIVIYSDYCVYSKNFIQTLMKYPDLYNSFIRMNIDVDNSTKKRPTGFYQIQDVLEIKITKVPTLITPNAQYVLSDVDAFKWLEYQVKLLTDTSGDLQPFNPNEMTSFSDNYANFGSTNLCDAKSQSFKFLQTDNGAPKLTDDNYLNTSKTWDPQQSGKTNGFLNELEKSTPDTDYNSKQSERQYFDKMRGKKDNGNGDGDGNVQMNMRDQYIQENNSSSRFNTQQRQPIPQQRMNGNINFTDPNFGLSGQMGSNGMSGKGKEMDMKLQKLMEDRETVDFELNKRPRNY
jgi:hypothetical protein